MIKEMKKGAYKFSSDGVVDIINGSGTLTRIRGFKKDDELDIKTNGKCRAYVDKNDNMYLPAKELNFLEAFIIVVGAIIGYIFIQTMLEIRQDSKLITCELRGDCSEVIRDINQ